MNYDMLIRETNIQIVPKMMSESNQCHVVNTILNNAKLENQYVRGGEAITTMFINKFHKLTYLLGLNRQKKATTQWILREKYKIGFEII